jgi:FkbM family methyltransferase
MIKRIQSALVRRLGALKERIINRLINRRRYVAHHDIRMTFFIPNALCRYRVETFSSKEPETLNWIDSFKNDVIFWDIGANIGLYSIYAAKAKNAQVLAFEPSVFNLEFLAKNIYANDLQKNISIFPLALSDKTDFNLFKMNNPIWGGALSAFGVDYDQSGGVFNASFEYSIAGLSADRTIEVFKLPSPSHIKIDVDGIEHLILAGAAVVLKKVDSILIEIDENFEEQSQKSNKYLTDAGLILSDRHVLNGVNDRQTNQLWIRQA